MKKTTALKQIALQNLVPLGILALCLLTAVLEPLFLSRENLLNIVWGYEYPGDVRTVDVHVRRLREKIEPNPSDPHYVYTKWGVGYFYKN